MSSTSMKIFCVLFSLWFTTNYTIAFTSKTQFINAIRISNTKYYANNHGYVPYGLTEDEYKKIKENDQNKKNGNNKKNNQNLGVQGPTKFKSRSLQGWQEAYDKGEVKHKYSPINYIELMKKKLLKLEDVPYMVRGGNWDNSDIKTKLDKSNKVKWSKTDHDYADGGYKKQQSVSILGNGPGFDWTGKGNRTKEKSYPGMF